MSATDPEDRPIFTAAEALAYRRKMGAGPKISPPQGAVFCFQRNLVERLARKIRFQAVKGFFGDLYLLHETGDRIALVANFGVGAPAAVVLLEELAAFGVRSFISIGLAGGLQADLRPGDLVVCERAIRDEGVSRHYLEPAEYAPADEALTQKLGQALARSGRAIALGSSWTTDAPYREMRSAVERRRRAGVKTVEMEAAALFAAGQHLGVRTAAAFVIADRVSVAGSGPRWSLEFDAGKTDQGLESLFTAAVAALLAAG
jgi:uridine phosphorylase